MGNLQLKNVNILLIGGANRVTLAEKIKTLSEGILAPNFFSMELDNEFYPIASVATVIPSSLFKSNAFRQEIEAFISKHENTIIIPCMDGAIPAVAELATSYNNIIAPSLEGANIGLKKHATAEFCKQYNVPHPKLFSTLEQVCSPVICKPIEGYGSKGIRIYEKGTEIDHRYFGNEYIVQEFIDGAETTHDVYISHDGSWISSSRDRLAVSGGEVDTCIVRQTNAQEKMIFRTIANSRLFKGPMTIQTMQQGNKVYLIEINCQIVT